MKRKELINKIKEAIDALEMIESHQMILGLDRSWTKEIMLSGIELACLINRGRGSLSNIEALTGAKYLDNVAMVCEFTSLQLNHEKQKLSV